MIGAGATVPNQAVLAAGSAAPLPDLRTFNVTPSALTTVNYSDIVGFHDPDMPPGTSLSGGSSDGGTVDRSPIEGVAFYEFLDVSSRTLQPFRLLLTFAGDQRRVLDGKQLRVGARTMGVTRTPLYVAGYGCTYVGFDVPTGVFLLEPGVQVECELI